MKLSDIRPCANCRGPLVGPGHPYWYVVRVSMCLLRPQQANEVLGMTQYFQGNVQLGELFSPEPDKAVVVVGDEEPKLMNELHVCFNCYVGMGNGPRNVSIGQMAERNTEWEEKFLVDTQVEKAKKAVLDSAGGPKP